MDLLHHTFCSVVHACGLTWLRRTSIHRITPAIFLSLQKISLAIRLQCTPTVSAAAAPRVLPVLPRARLPRNPSRPGSARRPPARTRELAARRAAVASVASPRRRRPLVSPSRGLHRLLTPRAPRSPSTSTADSPFPPARGPRRHAPSRAEPTTSPPPQARRNPILIPRHRAVRGAVPIVWPGAPATPPSRLTPAFPDPENPSSGMDDASRHVRAFPIARKKNCT